jgi:hypothetical protein
LEISPDTLLNRRLVGSESRSEGFEDEKFLVSVENQTTIPHAGLPQLIHYND